MFLLDTGHISPHGGEQAAWLDAQLSVQRNVPNKFAVYHVPLYPSVRGFDGGLIGRGAESLAAHF